MKRSLLIENTVVDVAVPGGRADGCGSGWVACGGTCGLWLYPFGNRSAQLRIEIVRPRKMWPCSGSLPEFCSVAFSDHLGSRPHPGSEMPNNVNSVTFRQYCRFANKT